MSVILIWLLSIKCPVLENAVPVCNSYSTAYQKWVCKIILSRSYLGYSNSLGHLGLCNLVERQTQLCLDFARKFYKSGFRDRLHPLRRELTNRQMRNSNKMTIPRSRTERYRRSLIPYMCRLLNDCRF